MKKNEGKTGFESVSKYSPWIIVHFFFRKITKWGTLLLLTQKCTGQLLQSLELLHQNFTWSDSWKAWKVSTRKSKGGGIDGASDGALMPVLVPTLLCGMGLISAPPIIISSSKGRYRLPQITCPKFVFQPLRQWQILQDKWNFSLILSWTLFLFLFRSI